MKRSFLFLSFIALLAAASAGCASAQKKDAPAPEQAAMTQAAPADMPQAPERQPQEVRTPLPPQTLGEPLPDDYEEAELDAVMPDSSPTFDPFTYGRPGSLFNRGALFGNSGGSSCGPMEMPMSTRFADPGESQAVILIFNNGAECIPDIDHDKPGAAVTFQSFGTPFAGPGWTISSIAGSTITISNGVRTIRFTYRVDASADITSITKVEYLS